MRLIPPCPAFDDLAADLKARNLHGFLVALLALSPLFLVMTAANPAAAGRWLSQFIVLATVSSVSLLLLARRRVAAAGWTAIAGLSILAAWAVASSGGTTSYGFPYFLIAVIVASSVLGRSAGFGVAALAVSFEAVMVALESAGLLGSAPVNRSPLSRAINNSLFAVAVAGLDAFASGRAEKIIRFAMDELAERRRVESALRSSEGYRRLLFDDSHVPLVVMDPETGKFTDCNEAAAGAYGLESREEVVGLGPADVSAPLQYDGSPSGPLAARRCAEAGEAGTVVFEWLHRRPDGERWDAEVHLTSFEVGGRRMLQFAAIDITARKRAEGEIKALNAQLEARVAARTAELSAANASLEEALEKLTASREAAVKNARMAALGQLSAGVAHEINTPLGAMLSAARQMEGTGRLLGETVDLAAGLDAEARGVLKRLLEAVEPGEFPASLDRRSRKANLEALVSAGTHESVAEELADLGAVLSAEETAAMARRADFPRLARLACQAGRLAQSRWIVQNAAERAASAVRAMKHYGRRREDAEPVPADISVDLRTALALFAPGAKRELRVELDIGPLPRVLCYPDRLSQVWINLIDNALQSMRNKGRLSISARAREGRVSVSVADDGPGIPPEIRHRIFEPFFTTKPAGSGTGLGLDICRKTLEEIGGSIDFESAGGRTVFTVSLPAL